MVAQTESVVPVDVNWRAIYLRYLSAVNRKDSIIDPTHLVAKLHDAVLVGFDLRQMEGHIFVELVEEGDSIANQNRQDRITNFVRQPATKAFAGDYTAPTNQIVRNLSRRCPFTNCARSPE